MRSSRNPLGCDGLILPECVFQSHSSPNWNGKGGRIQRRNIGWVVLGTLLVVAVAAIVVLRWREQGFQWEVFAGTFRRVRWQWMAISATFGLCAYAVRALRWQVMLWPVTTSSSFWRVLSATAVGFAAVVLLGRPGEVVRPYLIARKERVPMSSQIAAWLLERILDLLTILVVFGIGLTQVGDRNVGPRLAWLLNIGGHFAGILGSVCLVLLFVFRQYSEQMRARLLAALAFLPERAYNHAKQLVTSFLTAMEITRSPGGALWLFVYTLVEWLVIMLSHITLFQALPETAALRLMDVILFLGFVAFGSIVQIPGVGGGFQIVAILVLTELFGVQLEVAGSFALLAWIVSFVIIVPPGVLLALHEGLNWRKIKDIEAEAEV